jgi:hypothetical protein
MRIDHTEYTTLFGCEEEMSTGEERDMTKKFMTNIRFRSVERDTVMTNVLSGMKHSKSKPIEKISWC